MRQKIVIVLIFALNSMYGQSFYINTSLISYEDQVIEVDLSTCGSTDIYTCPPGDGEYYYDIAIDNLQNLYFSTADGKLYKRNLSNPNSCEYIGTFGALINGLTADPICIRR